LSIPANIIIPDTNISPKEIYDQVDRICQSQELSSKQQLCRLFRYLVEETLNGRGKNLKGYTIAVELFKKESTFDTVQDPLVRIHAGRLRRMLKMYYLDTGKKDPIRIEIPKGNYVPVFLPNSFYSDNPDTAPTEQNNLPFEPVIAIQAFKNMTGDPDKDYFALGFSEELSVELTKFEDLIVYNGLESPEKQKSSLEMMESAGKSGIRFIIEGSVSLDSTRVKVLVKLSDVFQRKHIWAERYIRDLSVTNLIDIQENIVHEIAGELGSEYGIIMQQFTTESKSHKPEILDTYNAILKFYYYEANHTAEASLDASKALEEAISNEPGSGIATAMLASLHATRFNLDMPNAEESYKNMEILAEKALRLDPHSLTVRVIYTYKWFTCNDREQFFKEADKCLSMRTNSPMRLGSVGFHLSLFGDWDRGKSLLDRVLDKRVRYPLYYHGAIMLYYYRKQEYDIALEEAKKYDIPSLFWGPMLRVAVLGQLNRINDARTNIDHLKQLKPDFEKKAHYLISRFVKEEDLVELVVDGLRKAGLSIPQSPNK
jgi:TolB-like protein